MVIPFGLALLGGGRIENLLVISGLVGASYGSRS